MVFPSPFLTVHLLSTPALTPVHARLWQLAISLRTQRQHTGPAGVSRSGPRARLLYEANDHGDGGRHEQERGHHTSPPFTKLMSAAPLTSWTPLKGIVHGLSGHPQS
jgi:hypothetical protein